VPDQPETDQPDKLDLASLDIAEERQQGLLRLFLEVRTEGGKLDFDRLKLALGETVDVGKERYGMRRPGKADCFRTIQAPSHGSPGVDAGEAGLGGGAAGVTICWVGGSWRRPDP